MANLAMLLGGKIKVKRPEAAPAVPFEELRHKALVAVAGRILAAVKDESPDALVAALEDFDRICDAEEEDKEDESGEEE